MRTFCCSKASLTLSFFVLICISSLGQQPVDYVNPYMGNISHLLVPTFPTIHLPNSMLRVYPDRADFTTDVMRGLPVVVTSHRGPRAFAINPLQDSADVSDLEIKYSYDREVIKPYRYTTFLDEHKILVDFAPSRQSAVYELRYEKNGKHQVLLTVNNGELNANGDGIGGVQQIEDSPAKVYLYLETLQKPVSVKSIKSSTTKNLLGLVLDFGGEQVVNIRYGISFISVDQARRNLRRELNTYDVEALSKRGRDIWNATLGKIRVEGGMEADRKIFYTSLYRTYERMINVTEDGKYFSPFDGQIHQYDGTAYTDDWIWDTFHATHPLRILIEPDMERDMIRSYLRYAQQSKEKWLPTFPTIMGDLHSMNGNHGVAMIADAHFKGLGGFDLDAAYSISRSTLTERSILPWTKISNTSLDTFYYEKGFFPALNPGEKESLPAVHSWEKRQPIAITLGKCYDDWCLAQLAKVMGKQSDYDIFNKQSFNYRNVFNSTTGFFHPRNAEGKFIEPFDYRFSGGLGARDFYDENNAWVYRWEVYHHIADLVSLMGGKGKFVKNLDATFREPLGKSKWEFYTQLPDQTGNVGQYSMANEPCMHIPYLYNYAGKPWMTQKRIRQLMKYWFRNDLMGVPGDEDGGGLSAFVVFSAMGFYPLTPGLPVYNIGSPLFNRIRITLGNGKILDIEARGNSEINKYIQSATFNGNILSKAWFYHKDIANGGKLLLIMGEKPNESWGSADSDLPPSGE
jgi:predicted alpha-1,2-mannosidase